MKSTKAILILVAALCGLETRGGEAGTPQVRWSVQQQGAVKGCAISPDATKIAAGSVAGTVFVYDAATGNIVQSINGHSAAVNQVAFSPDNTLLASTSDDKTVRIWNVADGSFVRAFTNSAGFLWSVVFSRDSKSIFVGGAGGFMKSWNVGTGASKTFTGQTATIWSLDVSPDGTTVVSGSGTPENRVRLWTSGGSSIRNMTGHTGDVRCVRFSPDGAQVASASSDTTIRLWKVSTGQARGIRDATNEVYSVDYSPDSQNIAAGSWPSENKLRFWYVYNLTQLGVVQTYTNGVSAINCLRFSPAGNGFVYASEDGTVTYARNEFAVPFTLNTVTNSGGLMTLSWSGAALPPFQVETRADFVSPWETNQVVTNATANFAMTNTAAIVRVRGIE